ncbi:MAG: hypothetical protein JW783_15810 [Bacteroidales bacterium]|nr:hypothetical protein [Bacteroidales bacterium]MBN2750223.1 hypothetical protein [Bacteroidales bacterium]
MCKINSRSSYLIVFLLLFVFSGKPAKSTPFDVKNPPFVFPFAQMSQSDLSGGGYSELDSTNQLQIIREHSVLKAIADLRYNDALAYLYTCLAISGDEKDTLGLQMAYSYLSIVAQVSGNTDESLRFALMCDSLENTKSNKEYHVAFKAILGSALYFTGDTSRAYELLYPISEVVPKGAELSYIHIYALNTLGQLYLAEKDLDSAELVFKLVAESGNRIAKGIQIDANFSIAKIYFKRRQPRVAHSYLQVAHDDAVKTSNHHFLSRIYTLKARYLLTAKKYKGSALYFAKADSVVTIANSKNTSEGVKSLIANYKASNRERKMIIEKQRAEIDNLKLSRKVMRLSFYLLSLILLLSLVAIGFMIYDRRKVSFINSLLKEIAEKKQDLLSSFVRAQESERKRFARDLHDGIGSMIALLKMSLAYKISKQEMVSIAEQEVFLRQVDDIYLNLRDVAFNLMPIVLVKEGLNAACSALVERLNVVNNVFSFNALTLSSRLPSDIEYALFRVTQEITTNIVKHANASWALVEFTNDSSTIGLQISYEGKGFNPEELKTSTGYGWRNIRVRLEQVGGSIVVDSAQGESVTTYIIEVPFSGRRISSYLAVN